MEARHVKWSRRAHSAFNDTVAWYLMNCNATFARSYSEGILSTIQIIATIPSIGLRKITRGSKTYAEIISHPKTIIRYWYSDKLLYVYDIIATQTDNK